MFHCFYFINDLPIHPSRGPDITSTLVTVPLEKLKPPNALLVTGGFEPTCKL